MNLVSNNLTKIFSFILKKTFQYERKNLLQILFIELLTTIFVIIEMIFYYFIILLVIDKDKIIEHLNHLGIESVNYYYVTFLFLLLLGIYYLCEFILAKKTRFLGEKVHILFLNHFLFLIDKKVNTEQLFTSDEESYIRQKTNTTSVLIGKSIEVLIPLIKNIFIMLLMLGVLLYLNLIITLILFVISAFFVPLYTKVSKHISQVSNTHFETTSREFNQFINQIIKNIFSKEKSFKCISENQKTKAFFDTFNEFLIANNKTNLIYSSMKIFILATLIIYILSHDNTLDTTYFIIYFFVLKQTISSLQSIVGHTTTIVRYFGLISSYLQKTKTAIRGDLYCF